MSYIDQYSDKVKEHFLHPKNMGEIKPEDLHPGEELVVGEVGNPACGDLMTLTLKIKDKTILDAKIKTFGCAAAIACSSITTEMIIGKTIEEARKLTKNEVTEELGGLPPLKVHCSNLAVDALKKALDNYEKGINVVKK
ncbi:iron-sulfur cluster assembly scaffold protein [Candidatus Woesearchaeota archaeon]|nr:iron-sulfur cluster assembly scaffold protein [Candidatus Woesearchaeota archaeon]MBW3014734.1 iron-sulfur cluster assembly scaffold protein [Candidatus Woesearchaeota archaeon]